MLGQRKHKRRKSLSLIVTCTLLAVCFSLSVAGCVPEVDEDDGDKDGSSDDDSNNEDSQYQVTLPSGIVIKIDQEEAAASGLPFPVEELKLEIVDLGGLRLPERDDVREIGGAAFAIMPEGRFAAALNIHVTLPNDLRDAGTRPVIAENHNSENLLPGWEPTLNNIYNEDAGEYRAATSVSGLFGVFEVTSEFAKAAEDVPGLQITIPNEPNGKMRIKGINFSSFDNEACLYFLSNFPSEEEDDRIKIGCWRNFDWDVNPLTTERIDQEGIYIIDVARSLWYDWSQFISIDYPPSISSEKLSDYARKYSPVLSFHENERFSPIPVDKSYFQFSGRDAGAKTAVMMPSLLEYKFVGDEIVEFMSTRGHKEAILNAKGSEHWERRTSPPENSRSSIYWTADTSENDDYLYLTYWMFYSHDEKISSRCDIADDVLCKHYRDRESISVILSRNSSTGDYSPVSVAYYGHIASQQMQYESVEESRWKDGYIVVPWHRVEKDRSCNHPTVYIAQGTHATYPRQGKYKIYQYGAVKVHTEEAGGGSTHCPNGAVADNCDLHPRYFLEQLGSGSQLSSDDESWKHLGFSGYWVDGEKNSRFPPFLARNKQILEIADHTDSEAEEFMNEKISCLDEPVWRDIPGGTFTMGCSDRDYDCQPREKPAHDVTISPFEMTATEITQRQYWAEMSNNPSEHQPNCGSCPVERVSWHDAVDYCAAVGGRLPTEAEWEYAARAGTTSPYYCGSGGCVNDIAWHVDNSGDQSQRVAQKEANDFDLYDMSGNIAEWTADWYDTDYYSSTPAVDPQGPATGSNKVARGGSFHYEPKHVRSSYREGADPEISSSIWTGIRCVRD
ncbi:MAG: formylglycine-generating enzyme family protein [Deltaproteobacteria bacterium]|nr:formylglycine-generating enzyme family protein [Deltaproteobacteria bacterium]